MIEWEAHSGLGNAWETQGRFEFSRTHFEAALEIARRLGDRRREGRTLGNLGILHVEQGNFEEGRALYEAALGRAREMGDRQWEANTLCNLGLLHQLEDRSSDAKTTLEAALVVAREMGNVRVEGIVLCNLGIVFDALGEFDTAHMRLEEALAKARGIGDQRSEGQFLAICPRARSRAQVRQSAPLPGKRRKPVARGFRSIEPRHSPVRPRRNGTTRRRARGREGPRWKSAVPGASKLAQDHNPSWARRYDAR